LKTKTGNIRAIAGPAAFDAWPSAGALLVDDPYDGEGGIFPEPGPLTGVEAGSRARSRIRALCGLAAAGAWMFLAAVIGVLQRA
jgi:hypothetical protein